MMKKTILLAGLISMQASYKNVHRIENRFVITRPRDIVAGG
jgi:hypothetical protein